MKISQKKRSLLVKQMEMCVKQTITAIPKFAKMRYAVQIYQRKRIARMIWIVQQESIALLTISIVMILKLREELAQRIQNADGSPVVFKILTALFNLVNIGVQ